MEAESQCELEAFAEMSCTVSPDRREAEHPGR